MTRNLTRKQQKAMFARMNDKTFNDVDEAREYAKEVDGRVYNNPKGYLNQNVGHLIVKKNYEDNKKEIQLLEGHKVTPIKSINPYNSRFAYEIKGFKGLYTLEGVDINSKKFIYKEYKE